MQDQKVFKANDLVNARYKLNPVELKLVLYAISAIKPDDSDFWTYTLQLKDLGIDYKELKTASRTLMQRVFEVKTPDGWLLLHWVSSIEYDGRRGLLSLSFDPKLRPYLLQLKEQFTAYDLSAVLPMRSSYAIRLYELLMQYKTIGHRLFDMQEFRDLLKIPASYTYKDIRRQILEPAIAEINRHGSIAASYEPIKTGRAYTGLRFSIEATKPRKESLRAYIERIRKTCANKTLTTTTDKDTGEPVELSVSADGLLYNKLDPDWRISKKRAMQIWKQLQRSGVCPAA